MMHFRAWARSRPDYWLTLTVLVVAPTHSAFGQTPTPPPEPPPRLEASAQLALVDTRGNAPSQTLGFGGELAWRPDPWTYNSKVLFAQNKADDVVEARSIDGMFRAARTLNERLSVFGRYDFLRDVFAGVEQRHVVEGGVSYLASDTAPHRLRLDAGLGYLYENNPDGHFDSVTLSLGAAYRLTISQTSEFSYEPRFLQTLAEAGAWKFDQDAALKVALNTILSLKLSHTLRYSAKPPEGFDTTDTIMAVSLVAKVKRPK
jgi:putative salt-induced outer membrane protein YdiY